MQYLRPDYKLESAETMIYDILLSLTNTVPKLQLQLSVLHAKKSKYFAQTIQLKLRLRGMSLLRNLNGK